MRLNCGHLRRLFKSSNHGRTKARLLASPLKTRSSAISSSNWTFNPFEAAFQGTTTTFHLRHRSCDYQHGDLRVGGNYRNELGLSFVL